VAIPLGVGGSRLYRGMHHPSDVIAGLLLGAAALALSYRIVLAKDAEAPLRRAAEPASVGR
jgi:undecaprenyl-diphosphatase